jgi:hypothetical protein
MKKKCTQVIDQNKHTNKIKKKKSDSMWALIEFACLLCYLINTICSQRLEPPGRAG